MFYNLVLVTILNSGVFTEVLDTDLNATDCVQVAHELHVLEKPNEFLACVPVESNYVE